MRLGRLLLLGFLLVYLVPIAVSAASYGWRGRSTDWRTTDRSSIGLLPAPTAQKGAMLRIFSARTVGWRGIFATHCWIVFKDEGGARYERYDYTAWGDPIRTNGFSADGRWFGAAPKLVYALDGPAAAAAAARMRHVISTYAYRTPGSYRAWPGPNSNTFITALIDAVPPLEAVLPATAIGRDFPYDGRWLVPARHGLGFRLRLGGYAGLTIGWYEGVELNILGAVAGFDIRRPAIQLPALGRFGLTRN